MSLTTASLAQLATCLSQSVYDQALTRGMKYPILAYDQAKGQIRIRADNQRIRWFPAICFDLTGQDCLMISAITLDDPIHDPYHECIEVTISLSNGQERWCFCVTPSWLASAVTRHVEPKQTELHGFAIGQLTLLADYHTTNTGTSFGFISMPHMITLSSLSHEIITAALEYINNQDELLSCTRARNREKAIEDDG